MIKLNDNSIVYIYDSSHKSTGGAESLHQLAENLINKGIKTYIYYEIKRNDIKKELSQYKISITDSIIDDKNNLLVVPEVSTEILYKYKNIKKCIWWLSLDNYLFQFPKHNARRIISVRNFPGFLKLPLIIYIFFKSKKKEDPIKNFKELSEIWHLYNCEYAKNFIVKEGVKDDKMHYLCGPITVEKDEKLILNQKEKMVIYNTYKGKKYISKIIKLSTEKIQDVKFVPIEKLTKKQVFEYMSKAILYMDFGYFPGPERMPREAVVYNCNILVGLIGSTRNEIDIPIPVEYKFEMTKKNVDKIVDKIRIMVDKPESFFDDFNYYRKIVRNQQERFATDIESVFEV